MISIKLHVIPGSWFWLNRASINCLCMYLAINRVMIILSFCHCFVKNDFTVHKYIILHIDIEHSFYDSAIIVEYRVYSMTKSIILLVEMTIFSWKSSSLSSWKQLQFFLNWFDTYLQTMLHALKTVSTTIEIEYLKSAAKLLSFEINPLSKSNMYIKTTHIISYWKAHISVFSRKGLINITYYNENKRVRVYSLSNPVHFFYSNIRVLKCFLTTM